MGSLCAKGTTIRHGYYTTTCIAHRFTVFMCSGFADKAAITFIETAKI